MTRHEVLASPRKTNVQLMDGLELLAKQQQDELLGQPSLPDNLTSRKAIFSWFKGTPEFQEIYSQAVSYLSVPRTDEETKNAREDIAGEVFQRIAYAYLSRNLASNLTLLSHMRTFNLYRILYPGKKVVKRPIGSSSLKGISVPDGLLIENGASERKVVTVVEYTLEGKFTYFEKKFNAFTIDKYKFLPLFGQSSLLFVTPTFRQRPSLPPVWKAKIQELPFTHHQFRNFFNSVYEHYRQYENIHMPDESSATLKEFQEEARYQGGRR